MKWLTMTRVFRLGSILKIAVPAAAALMAGAFWAGVQFQEGRQARATLADRDAEQATVSRTVEHRSEVSSDYEQRRAERDAQRRLSDAELRLFIAASPDLWDCDIGADGLRLIRSWVEAGARPATGQPDHPVSNPAEPAGHRPAARSAGRDEGLD